MADNLTIPWGLLHKLKDEEKIIKDDYKSANIPEDYKTRENGYHFYNNYGQIVQWNASTMNTLIPDKAKDLINKGQFYIALASQEADIPRCDYIPYEFAISRVTKITVDNITISKVHINVDLWRDINGVPQDNQLRAFRVFYDTVDSNKNPVRIMRIFLGYIRYISPKSYIKGINRYRYI